MLLDKIVDLRADAAHDLAAALGQPQLRPRMLEPRILAWGDQSVDFVLQWRNPGWVVLINLPREIDEGFAVGFGFGRTDGDGSFAHGALASASPRSAPAKPVN